MSMELLLSPIELRYVATCYPFHDRPYYDEAISWKRQFMPIAQEKESVAISFDNLGCAFPTLYSKAKQGLFETMSVQQYFEDLGPNGHNATMASIAEKLLKPGFAKKIAEKQAPGMDSEKWLHETLKHLEHCSVKVCRKKDGEIWWFGGVRTNYHVDYARFNVVGDYVFVHGFEDNKPVAIREATKKDFNSFKEYFDKHAVR